METTRLVYCSNGAYHAGERRHSNFVMRELAEQQGFEIVEAECFPIADQWQFVVKHSAPLSLPPFITVFQPRK